MTAYDLVAAVKDKWGHPLFAPPAWSWYAARAVVPHGEMLYMANDTDVFAVPRAAAAAACGPATGFDTNKQPDWSKCAWRKTDQKVPDALILAGTRLVAGGAGKVVVYDAANGSVLWTAAVEGRARGLAVANGRLLVSTTTGRIYSFAASGQGHVPI